MAKGKKAMSAENTEEQADQNANALAVLQAKHEALTDEVLTLREQLALVKTTNRVANSASIAPPPPAAPERPVVEVDGEKYQFKVGEVRLGRDVVSSTDIAADKNKLYDIFSKYPGLFQKL